MKRPHWEEKPRYEDFYLKAERVPGEKVGLVLHYKDGQRGNCAQLKDKAIVIKSGFETSEEAVEFGKHIGNISQKWQEPVSVCPILKMDEKQKRGA